MFSTFVALPLINQLPSVAQTLLYYISVYIFLTTLLNCFVRLVRGPPPPPRDNSLIRQPIGLAAFEKELNTATGIVVADFFATWCGPCVAIAPFVEDLADKNSDVHFLKVQEDLSPDTISAQSIRAFPTFRFYYKAKCVGELVGADRAALAANVARLKAAAAAGEVLPEVQVSAGGGGGCAIA